MSPISRLKKGLEKRRESNYLCQTTQTNYDTQYQYFNYNYSCYYYNYSNYSNCHYYYYYYYCSYYYYWYYFYYYYYSSSSYLRALGCTCCWKEVHFPQDIVSVHVHTWMFCVCVFIHKCF